MINKCEHEDIEDIEPMEIRITIDKGSSYLYWKHKCLICKQIIWEKYRFLGTTEEIEE